MMVITSDMIVCEWRTESLCGKRDILQLQAIRQNIGFDKLQDVNDLCAARSVLQDITDLWGINVSLKYYSIWPTNV